MHRILLQHAAPHVAGVAALIRGSYPSKTVQEVETQLLAYTTPNKISAAGLGSPNQLLYIEPTGCTNDSDCLDGNACNGAETCNLGTGTCEAGAVSHLIVSNYDNAAIFILASYSILILLSSFSHLQPLTGTCDSGEESCCPQDCIPLLTCGVAETSSTLGLDSVDIPSKKTWHFECQV